MMAELIFGPRGSIFIIDSLLPFEMRSAKRYATHWQRRRRSLWIFARSGDAIAHRGRERVTHQDCRESEPAPVDGIKAKRPRGRRFASLDPAARRWHSGSCEPR